MKVKISKAPTGDIATKYPYARVGETVDIADDADAQSLIDGGFGQDATGGAGNDTSRQGGVANQDKSR